MTVEQVEDAWQLLVENDASATRSIRVHVSYYAADSGHFVDDVAVAARNVPPHSRASVAVRAPGAMIDMNCRFAVSTS